MGAERRVRQAWHAAVLALVLCTAWISLSGAGRADSPAPGELPRPAVTAALPHSAIPVVPEARLIAKPSPGPLFLFAAAIVAFLFGIRRRPVWPAAGWATSAATPSMLLHAMRGRAPPRRPA
ncbi:hypothetical protein AB0F81_50070 [Actinoplanes sp. NPDC024001]|uniref:hypothetical protein n=1 Tax=Actinoplanes sp. NPDC024001 TaxID=3154598 RepID=UPI0033F9DE98